MFLIQECIRIFYFNSLKDSKSRFFMGKERVLQG